MQIDSFRAKSVGIHGSACQVRRPRDTSRRREGDSENSKGNSGLSVDAYRNTTDKCFQAHGGIAFTWEYELHIYLKRAKHNQFLYGSPKESAETICVEALGI